MGTVSLSEACIGVRDRAKLRHVWNYTVDKGLKTDALPGVAAVVVARHPAQARVVSTEIGERRRAGNGIGHVIVAAVGMRDGVPACRACATLKPYNLALKAISARGVDATTVKKQREIGTITLGLPSQPGSTALGSRHPGSGQAASTYQKALVRR